MVLQLIQGSGRKSDLPRTLRIQLQTIKLDDIFKILLTNKPRISKIIMRCKSQKVFLEAPYWVSLGLEWYCSFNTGFLSLILTINYLGKEVLYLPWDTKLLALHPSDPIQVKYPVALFLDTALISSATSWSDPYIITPRTLFWMSKTKDASIYP